MTKDYEQCVDASERVAWRLRDAVSTLDLDFSLAFLPPRLVGSEELPFLSPDDRRVLSHVRGYSYAHVFWFVEEFIFRQAMQLAEEHARRNRQGARGLLRFADDELKHQALFVAVKAAVAEGYPIEFHGIGHADRVADRILAEGSMAVMLFTFMLELMTQVHYTEAFRGPESTVCPAFREMFRLHWLEESQHARIDMLELDRLSHNSTPADARAALKSLESLCGAFSALLDQQVALDIASFEAATRRALEPEQHRALTESQGRAARWSYLISGLEHPTFVRVASELHPEAAARIAAIIDSLQ